MTRLPVIVGFGGYNAAGRSSFHHSYRRTVLGALDQQKQVSTLTNLAVMMGLVEFNDGVYLDKEGVQLSEQQIAEKYGQRIQDNTLIRKIFDEYFDIHNVPTNKNMAMHTDQHSRFKVARRDLPNPIPENWQVNTIDDKTVEVILEGELSLKMQNFREFDTHSAGMLPTGFRPAEKYTSRFHPRGLQMTVLGASDAINSIGIDWNTIMKHIRPDDVAVFASSGLGQTDEFGIGGYMKARVQSNRPSSKQMALGLNSMPADFVNAYVCGSVGTTGAMAGACASFLYNLRLAVDDIVAGRHRMVICGCSEAPVTPEVIEGFSAMGAIATAERIAKLDGLDEPDLQRASRPFGENCGFTMGESTQYFVLMDDALAIELGAEIYGAVPNVFVNADGFKKSISSPGAGNYVTMAKAVAATTAIVGDEVVKTQSYIESHGSSTPQNRVTESMIFDKVAKNFDIENWPVAAVKAFVGHPLGPASGDQLTSSLGVFAEGIIPGIKTVDKVADDVLDERLEIVLKDKKVDINVAFLNSKGFGGNNATASVLSPAIVKSMLGKRYSDQEIAAYETKREQTRDIAAAYDLAASQGDLNIIYNFGNDMIDDADISIDESGVSFKQFEKSVNLNFDNPYADMS